MRDEVRGQRRTGAELGQRGEEKRRKKGTRTEMAREEEEKRGREEGEWHETDMEKKG